MGVVVQFPARAKPAPLRVVPAVQEPKTFWHSGGSLHHRAGPGHSVHLEVSEAVRLRSLYEREAADSYAARDVQAARRAARLWGQLTSALDALEHHCRIVGRPSPIGSDPTPPTAA